MENFATKMIQAGVLLFFLLVLAIASCTPSNASLPVATPSPAPSTPTPWVVKTCTVAGCGYTLNLIFSGAYVGQYELQAAGGGHTLSVRCTGSMGQYPQGHFQQPAYLACSGQGVRFFNFAPPDLTVTLRQGSQVITRSFQPVYQLERPNGAGCPPECRSAELIFQLSASETAESPVVVWPVLEKVEPARPTPGSQVRLSGRGGYHACGLSGCDESAHSYKIYLDGQLLPEPLVCYVNHCEAEISLPVELTPGDHTFSTEGGSKLEILVDLPK